MTMRQHFRQLMHERRDWPRGSAEWEWRTRAARKYLWIHRGVPANQWTE